MTTRDFIFKLILALVRVVALCFVVYHVAHYRPDWLAFVSSVAMLLIVGCVNIKAGEEAEQ